INTAARLKGNTECRRTQTSGQRGACMLFQDQLTALNRFPIVWGKTEITLHRDDAYAGTLRDSCSTKQIDVVTGRLLDDLQISFALPHQLPDYTERTSM